MYGDELIVYVSSDEFNKIKNKKSVHDLYKRIEIVKSICFVDNVYIEEDWEQKYDNIREFQSNGNKVILVMGDDWKSKFDYLPCEVKYLVRTDDISSSELKKFLKI